MPITPSAKCVGTICGPAPINFECEYGDGWCQTIVMGGGGDSPFDVELKHKAPATYDHAEFVCQRVRRLSKPMAAAGVMVGDTVTHVDGQFFNDVDSFAAAVLDLRGKELRIIRRDGRAEFVTLK